MNGDVGRRNVVLVSVDSLRADFCGYVDGERDATPTLTGMAQTGTAFERAYAPGPSTPESMPAIFTGQYPVGGNDWSAGSLASRRDRIRRHLQARETLPERLSRLGYTTAAFTANPFTSRHFGFDAGFNHFQDFMGDRGERRGLYGRLFERFLRGGAGASTARMLRNLWRGEEVFKPWESYYDEVVGWVRTADEPWFVWVFLMDAHNPYLPGPAFRSQSRLSQLHANYRFWRESHETPFSPAVHDRLVTAYADAVRYADAFLSRLTNDLGQDDPVLVVHGDHGEAFGEHGSYGHEPYLYPENVHVPLVIDGVPSRTVSNPISLRRTPELVTDAAAGSTTDEQGAYAISRTERRQDAAVYTASDHYIRSDGSERGIPDPTRESYEAILTVDDEFKRERCRIQNTTIGGVGG